MMGNDIMRQDGPNLTQESLESLFYQGQYGRVLQLSFDSSWNFTPQETSFVVGSLVMSGRGGEAYLVVQKLEDRLRQSNYRDAWWACQFFMMMFRVRSGHYQDALNLKEILESHQNLSNLQSFYRYQALAFFHYYLGSSEQVESHLNESLKNAFESQFLWGRILAMDMRSHLQFQNGKIQEALKDFQQCATMAQQLGDQNFVEAIRITIELYKARLQVPSESALQDLEILAGSTAIRDTYSRANILIEISRHASLLGKWQRAELALKQALIFVYQYSNVKQEILLNMRWAYLALCHGENEKALNFISVAQFKSKSLKEPTIILSLWGFEEALIREMKFPTEFMDNFRMKKNQILKASASYFNRRIEGRAGGAALGFRKGEDPLGDVLDQISQSEDPFAAIVESGLLGLLKRQSLLPRQGVSVVLSDDESKIICSDSISIEVVQLQASKRMRQVLSLILQGITSRSQIFSRVWKIKYVPHLHDPVIYSTVAQLRKVLGRFAYILETIEHGYRLNPDVHIIPRGVSIDQTDREVPPQLTTPHELLPRQSNLNPRQVRLLSIMTPQSMVDTRTYSELFKVSTATANRDLRDLLKKKKIIRHGRSRDIAYSVIQDKN